MKKILLSTLFTFFSAMAFSQVIWSDNLDGSINSNTNPYYTNATSSTSSRIVNSRVTVTGIGRGSGTTGTSGINGGYQANGFTMSNSIDANDYFEFKITVDADSKVELSSFSFLASRSSSGTFFPSVSGPRNAQLRYSLNGGAFTTVAAANPTGNEDISLSSVPVIRGGETIVFRLYGYNAANNSNWWRIERFSFNGTTALPVAFGAVEAVQQNDAVNIKWTTLSETNNSYFDIEASADGETFTKIKTVQSQNGNSDKAQEYEVNITASDISSLLGAPLLLALLSLGFTRRKRMITGALALLILCVNFVACSKNVDAIDVNSVDNVFIRIKQVDKDGSASYSEVVKLIKKN